jgi:transcriptional regulator with XRE-family HTH domain
MTTQHPAAFGHILRRHRRDLGLSQEELAGRAGLSVRTIGDLERGVKVHPHRDTVRLLSDALDLSEQEFEALESAVERRRGPLPREEPTAASPTPRHKMPAQGLSLVFGTSLILILLGTALTAAIENRGQRSRPMAAITTAETSATSTPHGVRTAIAPRATTSTASPLSTLIGAPERVMAAAQAHVPQVATESARAVRPPKAPNTLSVLTPIVDRPGGAIQLVQFDYDSTHGDGSLRLYLCVQAMHYRLWSRQWEPQTARRVLWDQVYDTDRECFFRYPSIMLEKGDVIDVGVGVGDTRQAASHLLHIYRIKWTGRGIDLKGICDPGRASAQPGAARTRRPKTGAAQAICAASPTTTSDSAGR